MENAEYYSSVTDDTLRSTQVNKPGNGNGSEDRSISNSRSVISSEQDTAVSQDNTCNGCGIVNGRLCSCQTVLDKTMGEAQQYTSNGTVTVFEGDDVIDVCCEDGTVNLPNIRHPLENTFPWLVQFETRRIYTVLDLSIKGLDELMQFYVEHVSNDVKSCYMKPNRAAKLKMNLSEILNFFYVYYNEVKPVENSFYLNKMSDLLSFYIDMEIKASRRGKENVKKISGKLVTSLYLFLDRSVDHILDAILSSKLILKSFREICIPILRRVLDDIPSSQLQISTTNNYKNIMTYVRYMLTFKLWKRIVRGADQRRRINLLAISQLKPVPANLREVIKTGILNGILPNIPRDKVNEVTKFLMQAKFNVKDKSQKFVKLVRKSSQFELLTDSDRCSFFNDDTNSDISTDKKNEEQLKIDVNDDGAVRSSADTMALRDIKPINDVSEMLGNQHNSSGSSVYSLIDHILADIRKSRHSRQYNHRHRNNRTNANRKEDDANSVTCNNHNNSRKNKPKKKKRLKLFLDEPMMEENIEKSKELPEKEHHIVDDFSHTPYISVDDKLNNYDNNSVGKRRMKDKLKNVNVIKKGKDQRQELINSHNSHNSHNNNYNQMSVCDKQSNMVVISNKINNTFNLQNEDQPVISENHAGLSHKIVRSEDVNHFDDNNNNNNKNRQRYNLADKGKTVTPTSIAITPSVSTLVTPTIYSTSTIVISPSRLAGNIVNNETNVCLQQTNSICTNNVSNSVENVNVKVEPRDDVNKSVHPCFQDKISDQESALNDVNSNNCLSENPVPVAAVDVNVCVKDETQTRPMVNITQTFLQPRPTMLFCDQINMMANGSLRTELTFAPDKYDELAEQMRTTLLINDSFDSTSTNKSTERVKSNNCFNKYPVINNKSFAVKATTTSNSRKSVALVRARLAACMRSMKKAYRHGHASKGISKASVTSRKYGSIISKSSLKFISMSSSVNSSGFDRGKHDESDSLSLKRTNDLVENISQTQKNEVNINGHSNDLPINENVREHLDALSYSNDVFSDKIGAVVAEHSRPSHSAQKDYGEGRMDVVNFSENNVNLSNFDENPTTHSVSDNFTDNVTDHNDQPAPGFELSRQLPVAANSKTSESCIPEYVKSYDNFNSPYTKTLCILSSDNSSGNVPDHNVPVLELCQNLREPSNSKTIGIIPESVNYDNNVCSPSALSSDNSADYVTDNIEQRIPGLEFSDQLHKPTNSETCGSSAHKFVKLCGNDNSPIPKTSSILSFDNVSSNVAVHNEQHVPVFEVANSKGSESSIPKSVNFSDKAYSPKGVSHDNVTDFVTDQNKQPDTWLKFPQQQPEPLNSETFESSIPKFVDFADNVHSPSAKTPSVLSPDIITGNVTDHNEHLVSEVELPEQLQEPSNSKACGIFSEYVNSRIAKTPSVASSDDSLDYVTDHNERPVPGLDLSQQLPEPANSKICEVIPQFVKCGDNVDSLCSETPRVLSHNISEFVTDHIDQPFPRRKLYPGLKLPEPVNSKICEVIPEFVNSGDNVHSSYSETPHVLSHNNTTEFVTDHREQPVSGHKLYPGLKLPEPANSKTCEVIPEFVNTGDNVHSSFSETPRVLSHNNITEFVTDHRKQPVPGLKLPEPANSKTCEVIPEFVNSGDSVNSLYSETPLVLSHNNITEFVTDHKKQPVPGLKIPEPASSKTCEDIPEFVNSPDNSYSPSVLSSDNITDHVTDHSEQAVSGVELSPQLPEPPNSKTCEIIPEFVNSANVYSPRAKTPTLLSSDNTIDYVASHTEQPVPGLELSPLLSEPANSKTCEVIPEFVNSFDNVHSPSVQPSDTITDYVTGYNERSVPGRKVSKRLHKHSSSKASEKNISEFVNTTDRVDSVVEKPMENNISALGIAKEDTMEIGCSTSVYLDLSTHLANRANLKRGKDTYREENADTCLNLPSKDEIVPSRCSYDTAANKQGTALEIDLIHQKKEKLVDIKSLPMNYCNAIRLHKSNEKVSSYLCVCDNHLSRNDSLSATSESCVDQSNMEDNKSDFISYPAEKTLISTNTGKNQVTVQSSLSVDRLFTRIEPYTLQTFSKIKRNHNLNSLIVSNRGNSSSLLQSSKNKPPLPYIVVNDTELLQKHPPSSDSRILSSRCIMENNSGGRKSGIDNACDCSSTENFIPNSGSEIEGVGVENSSSSSSIVCENYTHSEKGSPLIDQSLDISLEDSVNGDLIIDEGQNCDIIDYGSDMSELVMDISAVAQEIEVMSEPKDESLFVTEETDYPEVLISKSSKDDNNVSNNSVVTNSDDKEEHNISKYGVQLQQSVTPDSPENEKKVPSIKIKIIQNKNGVQTEPNCNESSCVRNSESLFVCEGSMKTKRAKSKRKHKDREHHSSRHHSSRLRTGSKEDSKHDQGLMLPRSNVHSSRSKAVSKEEYDKELILARPNVHSSSSSVVSKEDIIRDEELILTQPNVHSSRSSAINKEDIIHDEELILAQSNVHSSRSSAISKEDIIHDEELILTQSNVHSSRSSAISKEDIIHDDELILTQSNVHSSRSSAISKEDIIHDDELILTQSTVHSRSSAISKEDIIYDEELILAQPSVHSSRSRTVSKEDSDNEELIPAQLDVHSSRSRAVVAENLEYNQELMLAHSSVVEPTVINEADATYEQFSADESMDDRPVTGVKNPFLEFANSEGGRLHMATCELDRTLCMSQFKFRDFCCQTYDACPSIPPVPCPSHHSEQTESSQGDPPGRCCCTQCSENFAILIANYKKLSQYRNARLKDQVEYKKNEDQALIKRIEQSMNENDDKDKPVEAPKRGSSHLSNSVDQDCSLPLKKRKTLVIDNNSENNDHLRPQSSNENQVEMKGQNHLLPQSIIENSIEIKDHLIPQNSSENSVELKDQDGLIPQNRFENTVDVNNQENVSTNNTILDEAGPSHGGVPESRRHHHRHRHHHHKHHHDNDPCNNVANYSVTCAMDCDRSNPVFKLHIKKVR